MKYVTTIDDKAYTIEINDDTADDPARCAVLEQVEAGVAIRMACLDILTRKRRGVEGWA